MFDVEMAAAYGFGMLDAQNIRPSLTTGNAPNFLKVPEDVPAPYRVESTLDAYRLGYWTECARIAQKFLDDNNV